MTRPVPDSNGGGMVAGSYNGSYVSHDSILLTKSNSKSPYILSSFTDVDWYDLNVTPNTRHGRNSISVLLGLDSMQSLITMSQKGERLPMMEHTTTYPSTSPMSGLYRRVLPRRWLESHALRRLMSNCDATEMWVALLVTLVMLSIAFALAHLVDRKSNNLGIHLLCMAAPDNFSAKTAILASPYSMLSSMVLTGSCIVIFGVSLYLAIECTHYKRTILANRTNTNLTSVFVLPCYEYVWYVLVVLALAGIVVSMAALHMSVARFTRHRKTFCFFQFLPTSWIRQLVPVMMIQKSISKAAVHRSISLSGLMSASMLSVLFLERSVPTFFIAFHCCLLAFYTWVKHKSCVRASFDYVYLVLCLTSAVALAPPILLLFRSEIDRSILVCVVQNVVDSFFILAIMLTLRADTKYWLGIDYNSLHTNDPARVYLRLIAEQGIASSFSTRTSVYDVHFMIEEFKSNMIDFSTLRLEAVVAQGATAVVLRGSMHQNSKLMHTPVAIKMYTSLFVTEEDVHRFSKETSFNVQLSHPNIVRFHGLCVVPPAICLIFEFCELGSLEVALDTDYGRALDLATRLKMCLDACLAVAYLHSFDPPLLHRDIKTANLLLATNGLLKLSDFGESNLLGPKSDGTMTIVGSVDFMAPEMILGGKSKSAVYGTPADVYSLTVTLWHILVPGIAPWSGRSHFDVYTEIIQGQRPPLPDNLAPGLADLLRRGWAPEPHNRPTVDTMAKIVHTMWLETCHRLPLPRTTRLAL
ncbi:TKL protein kinase, partial [Aphanomyces invadans]